MKIGGGLQVLDDSDFLNFGYRCIFEASSVKKPKSSNVLSQRKDFVKPVRKQYGNADSHAFKYFLSFKLIQLDPLNQLIRLELTSIYENYFRQ